MLAGAGDEKMPKCHLFGDTVNTAYWRESHSLPGVPTLAQQLLSKEKEVQMEQAYLSIFFPIIFG